MAEGAVPVTVWAVCAWGDPCGEPGCEGARGDDVLRLFATKQTAEQWKADRRGYITEITVHSSLLSARRG